jgi:beta-glucosidase
MGYRGYQKLARTPQFPFGFGLSYTTFSYSHLAVTAPPRAGKADSGARYQVTFDVTNTGSRAGADVEQIYVGESHPKIARPIRELKGFARSDLKPGETRTVSVPLNARSFAYYDVGAQMWRADAGEYRVELGSSSADIVASAVLSLSSALSLRP